MGKIVTFIINESTEKSFAEKVVDIWISNNFIEYYKEWNWGELLGWCKSKGRALKFIFCAKYYQVICHKGI